MKKNIIKTELNTNLFLKILLITYIYIIRNYHGFKYDKKNI